MVEYKPKDEIFIITHYEMEQLKIEAEKIMKLLPSHDITALITISFLKKCMEDVMHRPVKGIKVI